MKVLILNGNADKNNTSFDNTLESLIAALESSGNTVRNMTLRDMAIKNCQGCFGCWLKTPGECVRQDDGNEVPKQWINSDLVILASPLKMGFISAELKRAMDRSIGMLLPYIMLVNNECHHKKRYEKYPMISMLLEKEPDTDSEDIEIVHETLKRNALNVHADIAFFKVIDDISISELSDEINNI